MFIRDVNDGTVDSAESRKWFSCIRIVIPAIFFTNYDKLKHSVKCVQRNNMPK